MRFKVRYHPLRTSHQPYLQGMDRKGGIDVITWITLRVFEGLRILHRTYNRKLRVMSCLSSHKNPINRLHLRQFLGSKTTKANKLLKTDANEAISARGGPKRGELTSSHGLHCVSLKD